MKIGAIVFPGSNCDDDMVYVLKEIMQQHVVKLWHKTKDIQSCDMLILPGGFSYGDYLRSGAIARFSPIMESVNNFAKKGGLILGICNGFQILTEASLLPGTLLRNKNQRFVCKNAYIKPVSKKSPITTSLLIKPYKIPVAHAEGRYYLSEEQLKNIQDNDQIIFQYCDQNGLTNEESNFNGSVQAIAGVMNKKGNIMGMMPHPERAADPILNNTDGLALLESLLSNSLHLLS